MDIQLHFTEHGVGAPLVLLHGNGEDSTYFKSQIEYFERDYRVIALDTRWHGRSPRGTAPFTLAQFAIDLNDFMDGQGIETADIMGFSDGANVALLFALEHPGRVEKLVLNGANLFHEGLTKRTRRQICAEYELAAAAGDERHAALMLLMIDEPQIDPASLAALEMPVLVVAGTHDMVEEAHTRLIANSIPGAQLRFVEGSHFVAAENPDEFNRVVGEFLAQ